MKLIRSAATILIIGFLANSHAQEDINQIPINFEPGASSATVSGTIIGYEINDYLLTASGGQTMSVDMTTDHTANYFNVLPPGSKTAIYNSSFGENSWSGTLPDDGEYTIRVYMMRSAARRNEKARYSLAVSITGDAKVAGTPYHATGTISCSIDPDPVGSATCEFGVIRYGQGKAEVHVDAPWGDKYLFKFDGDNVSWDGSGTLKIGRESDNWKVAINGSRHFKIPDAVINGG